MSGLPGCAALMPLIFLHRNGKPDLTDAQSSTRHFNIHRRDEQAGCEMCSWQLRLTKMAETAWCKSSLQSRCSIRDGTTTPNRGYQIDSSKSQQPHDNAIGFCRHQEATNPSAAGYANASPSARPLEHLGAKTIEGVRGLKPPLTICHPLCATVGPCRTVLQ